MTRKSDITTATKARVFHVFSLFDFLFLAEGDSTQKGVAPWNADEAIGEAPALTVK